MKKCLFYCISLAIFDTSCCSQELAVIDMFTPHTEKNTNEGVKAGLGISYDICDYSIGMQTGGNTYNISGNSCCFVFSLDMVTPIADQLNLDMCMLFKIPKKSNSKPLSTAYPDYNTRLTTAGDALNTAATGSNVQAPYSINISQRFSYGFLINLWYNFSEYDASVFVGAGIMSSKIKLDICGVAISNNSAAVNICDEETNCVIPTFTVGAVKSISRKVDLKLQCAIPITKNTDVTDKLYMKHKIKYKNKSMMLMLTCKI